MKRRSKSLRFASGLLTILLLASLPACGTGAAGEPAGSSAATSAGKTAAGETAAPTAASESAAAPGAVQLPITAEPATIRIWHPIDANVTKNMENLGESEYYKELEKRTGVHVEFLHPTIGQEKESLNLLLASGDMPDLIQMFPGNYSYPGGIDKGIDDGMLMKLNDLVDKHAPNYAAMLANDEVRRQAFTDSGNLGAFYQVHKKLQDPWLGMVVRQDWLDELGIAIPQTYDDWHAMLTAFKEKKGAVAPLMLANTGFNYYDSFTAGFGVSNSFYQENGKVKYGPLEAGYKEYLTMMAQWYAEGLIDPDFATKKDFVPSTTFTTTGKAGAWNDIYILLSVDKIQSGDAKYQLVGVPMPRKTATDKLKFGLKGVYVGFQWTMSADCKNPELVTKWMDYTYSPEGDLLSNYGIEGKSFQYNAKGEPEYTGLMYANPEGKSLAECIRIYCKMPSGGTPYSSDRELAGQAPENLAAQKAWMENTTFENVMPTITLTSDEGNEYAAIMGDIETFISEKVVKYIMGQESMDSYDAFVQNIRDMNIDRAIELQQTALDRYNSR